MTARQKYGSLDKTYANWPIGSQTGLFVRAGVFHMAKGTLKESTESREILETGCRNAEELLMVNKI